MTSGGSMPSASVMNRRTSSVWPTSPASVVRKIRNGNIENRVMKAM